MTHSRDTVVLRDRFADFKIDKDQLKHDFEEYITAPHFSLDHRWQMFIDAPSDLSNHEQFLYHGLDEIITGQKHNGEWISNMDTCNERHVKFQLVDMVNEEFTNPDSYGLEFYPSVSKADFLNKVKEQILKDNIKSFVYDW